MSVIVMGKPYRDASGAYVFPKHYGLDRPMTRADLEWVWANRLVRRHIGSTVAERAALAARIVEAQS